MILSLYEVYIYMYNLVIHEEINLVWLNSPYFVVVYYLHAHMYLQNAKTNTILYRPGWTTLSTLIPVIWFA